MSEQTLTSLAILTVNWDRGHDLIESFVPLVAECIRQNGAKPVSLVELQAAVEQEAGIKVPSGALQSIVGRCARDGLVTRRSGAFYPDQEKLESVEYAPTQQEALRRHEALLDGLREFAETRYRVTWSKEDAQDRLLAFLKEGSVPVLAAATDGDPVPSPHRQSRRAKHILSAFVAEMHEKDPEGFACLEVVAKGFVLSGVLYYPDIGQIEQNFSDLAVYCDTPLLIRALGYTDEGQHVQAVDLLELLAELGADLRCFHHTREEVAGVLEGAAGRLRGGASNGSGDTDWQPQPMTRTFVLAELEEMIVRTDDTLRELGVEVVDPPDWSERPNETALDEALAEEIDYFRPQAREKDVKSLAAVVRLRGGRRVDKFETAKAVFVTTNTSLARASSRFFRDIEGTGAIPVCLPLETMTRLAWVKKPLSAPDLPVHLMMATAYAALNPPAQLWRGYLGEINRRKASGELTDDDYVLLRSSREARQSLMDQTLGEEEAFSAGTLDEVLAHVKATIKAEADEATAEERRQREAAEAEALKHEARADRIDQAHRRQVDSRASTLGQVASCGVAGVIGLILILGALATVPGIGLLEVTATWLRIVIWIGLLSFLGLSLYAVLSKQVSVTDLKERVASGVEKKWRDRGHQKLDDLHGDEE